MVGCVDAAILERDVCALVRWLYLSPHTLALSISPFRKMRFLAALHHMHSRYAIMLATQSGVPLFLLCAAPGGCLDFHIAHRPTHRRVVILDDKHLHGVGLVRFQA